ncbi:MAG: protein translocase subunit SecF [Herbinix sp.]|nr:protein translocase subunit SecF [Herbinix sp.]
MKNNKIIGFYSKRWYYFAFSLTIMAIGIIFALTEGVILDIQFKGGAILKYTYVGEIDENAAEDIATEQLDRIVTTQLTTDYTSGEKKIVFNLTGEYGVDANVQKTFDAALKAKFPNAKLKLSESQMVEKFFGDKFLRQGIMAILIAAVLIVAYVWIRFKMMGGLSAGVMALVALCHDVLIVFFTCVIFRIPIGESFVAVALSILGYSINDTIVIYDRIRENNKALAGVPVETIADLSITQSMMRSVNTNIAVMVSVSMVYIIAFLHSIESIQSFALPMAVGSISGCYSTICIAGPLWVMWKKKKGNAALFKEKSA